MIEMKDKKVAVDSDRGGAEEPQTVSKIYSSVFAPREYSLI
jgi:hypothetical protein